MNKIRKANHSDLEAIMALLKEASLYLASLGIDQWQKGYPDREAIENDIRLGQSYVLLADDLLAGTFALSFLPDPYYDKIVGAWLSDLPYGVIHRITIGNGFKHLGLATFCMEKIDEIARQRGIFSLRIDTHKDNLAMRALIEKQGYSYCGVIKVKDGLRNAYEKLLEG